jgi:hypothetical protein
MKRGGTGANRTLTLEKMLDIVVRAVQAKRVCSKEKKKR